MQYALSSGPETNSYDLTCYSCITDQSIMASEAFNNSNTLTVENIFIGHYSYYVKNVFIL